MRRIIALTLIIAFISTLALAESGAPGSVVNPKSYSVNMGRYKVVVITPIDQNRAILLSFFDESDKFKEPSAYLAEGIMALATTKLTRIISGNKPDNSKEVKTYLKKVIEAKKNQVSLKN